MERSLYPVIRQNLYKGKTILVFGPRRAGKTDLVKRLITEEGGKYYSGEWLSVKEQLSQNDPAILKEFIGNTRLVVIDEAQDITDIGVKLKVMHDEFPATQFIATGSSAFELAHNLSEPLTGRSRYYRLYPFSFREIVAGSTYAEAFAQLENLLRFGSYPEVYTRPEHERKEELIEIVNAYLYKDVLTYGQIRRPDIIHEILKFLAFQTGREVSLNEISNKTNVAVKTVIRYLDILEKAFVITSLGSFSRNLRNELGKAKKYYFTDTGIRNALINNFNPLSIRNDTGQLWENFCVLERMKNNEYARRYVNAYFWRTYEQKEIDYIEEIDGRLYAYEFKWADEKSKPPKPFLETYTDSEYHLITRSNISEFL